MGCEWLGGMLWQWDIVVALLCLKELICHSARRRSPNPLCPPSGCRHVALLALPPRRGVTDLSHHSPANAVWKSVLILWHCGKNGIPWVPVALLSAWCRYKRLSVHNCMLIQWQSIHQLWLPQAGSNTSGPRMCFWLQKASCKAKPLCLLSHFAAATICCLGFFSLPPPPPFFFQERMVLILKQ